MLLRQQHDEETEWQIWSCLDAENAYFHAEEDEDVYCWPPKEWVQRYHARGRRVENPWWKLKRQLHGRRKAAKKFNEFVVTATDGLGLEQCPEQPSLFRRPRSTLIFKCHQDDFYGVREQCVIGVAPRESGCKAQAEAGRANGSGITVQLPPCDENED